ncbi:hypothetical protein TNCV_4783241 [Trichonephila clavipes]|nr:hypothetical protein TNCV_4783241 [Trichonephila clavipes]
MDHPNASDARDFFTPANIAPEHPARQNSRTAPTVHLYQPTKTPTTTTSPSKQSNNPETISDIFEELKNPAVQETFELLEEFIKIATTIPTRFGRLRAIHQLCKTKLTFNPVNRNNSNLTLVSWNANGIRTRVDEFGNLSLNGIQTSLTFKKRTSNPVTTLPSLTTISTGLTAPAVAAELQF